MVKFKCRDTCSKYLPRLCSGEPISPTSIPTMNESLSTAPSVTPSIFYCYDDPTFLFEIVSEENVEIAEVKDCAWLANSEDHILEYCDEKVVGDQSKKRLKFYCRASCKDFLPRRCGSGSIR